MSKELKEKSIRILIGGSPCTYWSISQHPNKREVSSSGIGWELFLNYVIAKEKFKPDFFLYENNESISKEIQKEIEKCLGVDLLHINSSFFSAQSRKRIYGTNIRVSELPKDKDVFVKDIVDFSFEKENLIEEVRFSGKENTKEKNKPIRIGHIGKGGQGERVYSIEGKSCTLSANGGGRGAKTGLYLINNKVRKLNPLEAERLQTLPDNYTLCEGVSETNRYKGIGNGWTADVIIWILSQANIPLDAKIEVLSLYDGIGTGRYCLDKMGYKNVVYKAYEIEESAMKIALKNYADIIECGDAFRIRDHNWIY